MKFNALLVAATLAIPALAQAAAPATPAPVVVPAPKAPVAKKKVHKRAQPKIAAEAKPVKKHKKVKNVVKPVEAPKQ